MPKKNVKLPLSKTHPKLAKEADGWDPSEISSESHKRLNWRCRLDHTWVASVYQRTVRNYGCPYCGNKKVLIGFNDLKTTHDPA